MTQLLNFTIKTFKALQKYDHLVNTDPAEAQLKFADIWDECHIKLNELYKLPRLTLTGDGFTMGDATATQCIDTARIARKLTGKDVYFMNDENSLQLFDFLDVEFIKLMEPEVKKLVNYYNNFCAQYIHKPNLKTA